MSDEFTRLVERCSKNNEQRFIENESWNHALVLFKHLINDAQTAQEPIRLVTGHLNRDFYDALTSELRDYLNQETADIQVVVLDPETDLDEHLFAQAIKDSKRGQILLAPEALSKQSHPHFIVVGDRRFRLETDHSKTKAVANFNNPAIGTMLVNVFNNIRKQIDAPPQATA